MTKSAHKTNNADKSIRKVSLDHEIVNFGLKPLPTLSVDKENLHANTIAVNEKFIQTQQLRCFGSHVWNVIVSEQNKIREAKVWLPLNACSALDFLCVLI